MQLLKDQFYSPTFYRRLSRQLSSIDSSVSADKFYRACIKDLEQLELKQRLSRTSEVCKQFLPVSYPDALRTLYRYAEQLDDNSFSYMFMPDFVARYGRHDFKRSMQALKEFTRYSSSELAIRIFLQDDLQRTLAVIKNWTHDEDLHVRRLCSEGTRPRLPWAIRIGKLIEHPDHCFPILNDLHQDNEKYVQKSVANHLNDISKDHPQKMLALVRSWDFDNEPAKWIVKHGVRTLIKQGNKQALSLLGAGRKPQITVNRFRLDSHQLKLGDDLHFQLAITSPARVSQTLVIDYKIHYRKANGNTSPKVFKLRTVKLGAGETLELRKKHALRNFTTRKHYAGKHRLELVINGKSVTSVDFMLSV